VIFHPPWLDEVVPYAPGRSVEEVERELGVRGFVKLASNENPLGPSPDAIAAVGKAAAQLEVYPDAGTFDLRHRLGEWLGVDPAEVMVGAGSTDLINLLVRTSCTHWDNVVLSEHAFLAYQLGAGSAGVPIVRVPDAPGFRQDLPALAAACDLQTRLLFVANPNNPTGTWHTHTELAEFLAAVPDHVTVVLDEAYLEYVDAPDPPRAAALRALRENLVILRTFSKAYALAGLRVGYAVAPRRVVSMFDRVRQPFHVTSLGQAAAIAALGDRAHTERSARLVLDQRPWLFGELARLGFDPVPSQGNFFLIRARGGGRALFERLLKRGVIIRPLDPYGLTGHARVTIGRREDSERLLEALEADALELGT
jgi:histidinol-phosphate aminotransferase